MKNRLHSHDGLPLHLQKPKKESLINIIIMIFPFISVLILVYTLPDDILTRNPMLKNIVGYMVMILPSVRHFGEVSEFPEVAQFVFIYELLLLPFMAIFSIKIMKESMRNVVYVSDVKLKVIFILPLIVGLIIFMVYYFPLDTEGLGPSGQITRSIVNSRFGFAWWTSLFITIGVASGISIVIGYVKAIPIIFNIGKK